MKTIPKLQIEKVAYEEFIALWNQKKFQDQRLGQAFYNHFRLHKLADQTFLQGLYEVDGEKAATLIGNLFRFN